MNIMILGGDGFIGSYLTHAHINNQDQVIVVDVNNIRLDREDERFGFILDDLSFNTKDKVDMYIRTYKPDFIYNCVAVANPDYYVQYPIQTFDLDFMVNYNIIQSIMDNKVPFVHFSTSEVYGKKWTKKYTEDNTDFVIGPAHKSRWIYATSKILLEQLIKANDSDCCIIRPQNFCGWNMDWLPMMDTNQDKKWKPRLPACFLNNLFTNTPFVIVNPGTQMRCYTHINDAVDALMNIHTNWDSCKGETINIGNKDNEETIENVMQTFRVIWNRTVDGDHCHNGKVIYKDGTDFYGDGYEDCERRMFDDTKSKKLLQWDPKYNLVETITDVITKALDNYDSYLK